MTDNQPRLIEELADARSSLCSEPVPHPLYVEVKDALLDALRHYKLVFLVGPPGAGKTALLENVVQDFNADIGSDLHRLHAVLLETCVPTHNRFPWRDQLMAILDALGDPLPHRKINRESLSDGVQSSAPDKSVEFSGGPTARSSPQQLHKSIHASAKDRGLKLLVLDEAVDLIQGVRGRTLAQQLRVLRSLCSRATFRIVLASSTDLLSHVVLSTQLNRRRHIVFFPRYGSKADPRGRAMSTRGSFKAFSKVVLRFMQRVPEPSRVDLSNTQLRYVYARTNGCIGQFADWFLRAIARCVHRGSGVLEWQDFQDAADESDTDVAQHRVDCLEGEVRVLNVRTTKPCTDQGPVQGSLFDEGTNASPPAGPRSGGSRVGVAKATRREDAVRQGRS